MPSITGIKPVNFEVKGISGNDINTPKPNPAEPIRFSISLRASIILSPAFLMTS